MSLFELSSTHCPAQKYWHLLLYLKIKKKKKVKKKADYAISTLGDLYICTVNVFYFDFILLEKETREKTMNCEFFWKL